MPEVVPRWPCPVCLGATMEKTSVPSAASLVLDHCPRCGGIWFDKGEVQLLRLQPADQLWANVARRDEVSRAQCHACHGFIERDATRCPACGRRTRYDCPACQQPMAQARYGKLTLDVCKGCKGVWFDHHELAAIWQIEWNKALKRRRKQARHSIDAPDVLLDALTFAPDVMFYGAHTAGQLAASSAEALGRVPVGAAAEAVAEAASSVFEALVEIVAGIFSGF